MALPPFQTALDAHGAALLRFLRASVGPDEADDCLQETLLAALRAYPQLRSGSDVRAWLFTIARNKAFDAHRARRRRPVPVESPPDRPSVPPTDADDGLWSAVRALPPKQRAAVTLRYAGDLTHREVGITLGTSEDAARRNVHEGLAKLRREIA